MGKNLLSENANTVSYEPLTTDTPGRPVEEVLKSIVIKPWNAGDDYRIISPLSGRNGTREGIEMLRASYRYFLFGREMRYGVHISENLVRGAVNTRAIPYPTAGLQSSFVFKGTAITVTLPYHKDDKGVNVLTLSQREHESGRWCIFSTGLTSYLTLPSLRKDENGKALDVVSSFELFHDALDMLIKGTTVKVVLTCVLNRKTGKLMTWLQDEALKIVSAVFPTDPDGNRVAVDMEALKIAYRDNTIAQSQARTQRAMGAAGAKTAPTQEVDGVKVVTIILDEQVVDVSTVPVGFYAGYYDNGKIDPKLAFIPVNGASDRIKLLAKNRTFKSL